MNTQTEKTEKKDRGKEEKQQEFLEQKGNKVLYDFGAAKTNMTRTQKSRRKRDTTDKCDHIKSTLKSPYNLNQTGNTHKP